MPTLTGSQRLNVGQLICMIEISASRAGRPFCCSSRAADSRHLIVSLGWADVYGSSLLVAIRSKASLIASRVGVRVVRRLVSVGSHEFGHQGSARRPTRGFAPR